MAVRQTFLISMVAQTGGRQAAVEAQRFPNDFDGIAAGALFNNAVEIAMEQVWSSAVFFLDVDGDGEGFDNAISGETIGALSQAVLAACDVLGNDRIQRWGRWQSDSVWRGVYRRQYRCLRSRTRPL